MNKWEEHGYNRCIYDYESFGIKFCTNELERMLELTNGTETNSYKGYKMALEDIRNKRRYN